MTDNSLARNGAGVTPIPVVYTNQQLIDAFYYAAEALGIADYRQLLASAGLDLDALAAQRAAIYNGPAIDQLDGLSPDQRTVLQRELLGELLKQVRWVGLVNAPDGLNLRRTPGTQDPPLALLSHETLVQVLGESGDWLFVVAGGQPGYVFAAHVLRRIAPGPDEPSPGTPTTPADEDYAPPAEEQVAVPPGADSATRVGGRRVESLRRRPEAGSSAAADRSNPRRSAAGRRIQRSRLRAGRPALDSI